MKNPEAYRLKSGHLIVVPAAAGVLMRPPIGGLDMFFGGQPAQTAAEMLRTMAADLEQKGWLDRVVYELEGGYLLFVPPDEQVHSGGPIGPTRGPVSISELASGLVARWLELAKVIEWAGAP